MKLPARFGGINQKRGMIVGIDLGEYSSGVSFMRAEGDAETISTITGQEEYSIPTLLCKMPGENQWFYGEEAGRKAAEEGGILVDALVEKARLGETVMVDGVGYQPVSLLTLFLKRCLYLLSTVGDPDRMEALMVTVPHLDAQLASVLKEAVEGLQLKTKKIFLQSYAESFYAYMLRQGDLLQRGSGIMMELVGEKLRVHYLDCNRRTSPMVVYAGTEEYPFPTDARNNHEDPAYALGQQDRMLQNLSAEFCSGRGISAIYLVGDRFAGGWMKESLRFLCGRGRVFQGSNLLSKGACYGLRSKLSGNTTQDNTIFLGSEKLRCNVGIRMLRQGEEVYLALLDAGTSWFEAEEDLEFYLEGREEFELVITDLVAGREYGERVLLSQIPRDLRRMRLHLYPESVDRLCYEVEDLGLGEFKPSTGMLWRGTVRMGNAS